MLIYQRVHKITHRLAGVWLLKQFCRVLIQQHIGLYHLVMTFTVRHGKIHHFSWENSLFRLGPSVNVITSLGNLTVRVKTYLLGFLENGMWSTEKINQCDELCYTGDGKHTKSVAISGCHVLFWYVFIALHICTLRIPQVLLLSYCYGITYALYDQHSSTITVAILIFITI